MKRLVISTMLDGWIRVFMDLVKLHGQRIQAHKRSRLKAFQWDTFDSLPFLLILPTLLLKYSHRLG